jgi:hypothetical protein
MRSLSGGLVYEYSQEEANYGLVTIDQDGDGSVTILADYDNLQKQFNKLDVSALQDTNPSSASIQAPQCDASLITAQDFSKNFTVPAVCPGCQDLIDNGIEKPQRGTLVKVTDTQVKQKVMGSNGQEVTGLTLDVAADDGSNTPGGENTSPSSTTSAGGSNPSGTGAQPSATKTGGAAQITSRGSLLMLTVLIAFVLLH